MIEILVYLFLTILFGFYLKMMLEIWKYKKEQKSEWESYWDEVFNNAKNSKL